MATSDYSAIARAITAQNQGIAQANNYATSDFGKIAEQAIRSRSAERRAAIKAQTRVHKAGMDALASKKVYEIDADTKNQVASIKRPAKRMAGLVAAAGTLSSAYVMKQGADRSQKRHDEYMNKLEQNKVKIEEAMSRPKPPPPSLAPPPRMPNINFEDPSTPASGSATTPAPSPAPTPSASGGNMSMSYMKALTADGYTPTQAAALVGHLRVESGDFQYMEELEDNVYGTRGYGHLQWTNTPGSNRRDNFLAWTKGQNLDPSSFEGNYGFLQHEMSTNHGNVWTNGGSDQGFRQTGSLEDSSSYLLGNLIRPKPGSEAERIRRAKETLLQWQEFN